CLCVCVCVCVRQFNRRLLRVVQFVQQAEEGKQEISEVEKKIDDLEDTYNELDEQYLNSEHIENVKTVCDMKRRQLNWCSLQHDEHRVTEKREGLRHQAHEPLDECVM
ncbi:hypothetical protein QTP86_003976, partial [Hemibagrus guttatus]